MPIFVSFARYIFRIFIPKAEIIIFYCVKLLRKDDKLTQCSRTFTLALARLSCQLCTLEHKHSWYRFVRTSGSQQVVSHLPDLWHATRICLWPNPLCCLYGRSLKLWSVDCHHTCMPMTCRCMDFVGHLWQQHCSKHHRLHQSRHVLDAIKQASFKFRQDGVPVVLDCPMTTTDTNIAT